MGLKRFFSLKLFIVLTVLTIGSGFTSQYESNLEFSYSKLPSHQVVSKQIERKLQSTSFTWWLRKPNIEIIEVSAHPTLEKRYSARFRVSY